MPPRTLISFKDRGIFNLSNGRPQKIFHIKGWTDPKKHLDLCDSIEIEVLALISQKSGYEGMMFMFVIIDVNDPKLVAQGTELQMEKIAADIRNDERLQKRLIEEVLEQEPPMHD